MIIRFIPVFLLAMWLAMPAFGHAFLEQASPSAGSLLKNPPAAVTIILSATVETRFSYIQIRDHQGKRMDTGAVKRGEGRSISVDLIALPPGTYTVNWQVTSVDTHKTQGHYEFTVRP
jgi:methionine-rich copper-binding protein CopC